VALWQKCLRELRDKEVRTALWRGQARVSTAGRSRVSRTDFGLFSPALAGTRFDVIAGGSHRITGIRNFRQALASPYPDFHAPRFGAAHSEFTIDN
jgi:hypothetical protein